MRLFLWSVTGYRGEGLIVNRGFWSHPGTACRMPFNGADRVPDMSHILGFRSLRA